MLGALNWKQILHSLPKKCGKAEWDMDGIHTVP